MKKSNKDFDAEALEAALEQAVSPAAKIDQIANMKMVIFKFIDDKDVFQKFYQKKLAQRLVAQQSASDDSESSMITKLKESSGFEYTTKLTRMFTGGSIALVTTPLLTLDMNLSRDLTEKFNERERNKEDGGINSMRTHTCKVGTDKSRFQRHGTRDKFLATAANTDRLCCAA